MNLLKKEEILKNLFSKVIIAFIAILFLASPVRIIAQDNVVDQVVAVVGGNIILKSDIETQFYQLKQQGMEEKGDARCQILEELLYQKLLINQAELDSVEITPKEVENEVDRRMSYLIDQVGSVQGLEDYFGKTLQEMKDDFKDLIKERLLIEKMQNNLTGETKVTPSDVKAYFKKIPSDSIPMIKAMVEFDQIVIYPKVSEKEKLAVVERLQEFKERIRKGDKFATLAVLYSQDPGSAAKGGELGFLSRQDLVPEFSAVAFNLQPGEVSKVVETEFGYHIIQMIERKGELINVRHILLTPQMSEEEMKRAKKRLDSVQKLIRMDSVSFSKAAEKYSEDEAGKSNSGVAVNPYTGTTKFEIEQLDGATFYALKKLEIDGISSIFETVDIATGKKVYKIIKLKSRTPEHKANLKDDYQQIQEMALASKKQEIINDWIIKKRGSTYIRIDPSYAKCDFRLKGWIK